MDRMRELQDTTSEIDTALADNAEEGLDDNDLEELMSELDKDMADEDAAAAKQTEKLPSVPVGSSEAEMASEPGSAVKGAARSKLPDVPFKPPVIQTKVPSSVSTPRGKQKLPDAEDKDLEDLLINL